MPGDAERATLIYLMKRRQGTNFIAVFKYLVEVGCRKTEQLFLEEHCKRTQACTARMEAPVM